MSNFLPTLYQEFIYKSRYARWLDSEKRRENWSETVCRYFDYMEGHLKKNHDYVIPKSMREELEQAVLSLEVMPSMRALMTAGPALDKDNTGAYNCSYVVVDDPKAFDEAMVILMAGTGVGFSVERQYVQKLPEIPERLFNSETVIVVRDSKEGWGKALRQLIALLYSGEIPKWDVSQLRPAGAILKTFGGRSSGPEPLVDLFRFTVKTFRNAVGRKLNSLECHDIMCKIGEVVVVGGVRRSAMISLSNLSDDRMRSAKSGSWWETEPQRALANNSAAYTEKPEIGVFMREWISLYESKSGERGIFSRTAAEQQVKKFGRRTPGYEWGTNPCCLTADMNIQTKENGTLTLGEIVNRFQNNKETFEVLAYDEENKAIEWTTVEAAQLTRPNTEVIELIIETENGEKIIRATPDHPIYTTNRGYVRADELTEEDDLVISNLSEGKLLSREFIDNEDTYDIQTTHKNFFANDVLVHNSEIILRPNQFCNLSEIVIRPTDDEKSIMRKIRIATILGTFQSTLTHFPYLRKSWKKNTEEERLLGVSMTGIMDNALTNGKNGVDILSAFLEKGRNYAVEVNKELADAIGIEQSASISCVKPSGSASQLVDAASGIHARHNDFYVRTVRGDNKDPLTQFMIAGGFPAEPCVMKPDTTTVFSFPIKSPEDAVCRTEMSAIDQLNMWLIYQRHWCEHKPSVTITVKEHEWMEVGAFVYKHFDEISGISFLPHSDHIYRQAPYQDCSAEEYEALKARMPTSIDWVKLAEFEYEDMTKGMQSLACSSDGCELVDI
jgi:hypothetical protein